MSNALHKISACVETKKFISYNIFMIDCSIFQDFFIPVRDFFFTLFIFKIIFFIFSNENYPLKYCLNPKTVAELQWTEPGTKVTGQFSIKGRIFPPNAQYGSLLLPSF